jgi:hypothetical protein
VILSAGAVSIGPNVIREELAAQNADRFPMRLLQIDHSQTSHPVKKLIVEQGAGCGLDGWLGTVRKTLNFVPALHPLTAGTRA